MMQSVVLPSGGVLGAAGSYPAGASVGPATNGSDTGTTSGEPPGVVAARQALATYFNLNRPELMHYITDKDIDDHAEKNGIDLEAKAVAKQALDTLRLGRGAQGGLIGPQGGPPDPGHQQDAVRVGQRAPHLRTEGGWHPPRLVQRIDIGTYPQRAGALGA
ncbi:hypothetical protein FOZ62_021554, partial [Perkinsus olseni]